MFQPVLCSDCVPRVFKGFRVLQKSADKPNCGHSGLRCHCTLSSSRRPQDTFQRTKCCCADKTLYDRFEGYYRVIEYYNAERNARFLIDGLCVGEGGKGDKNVTTVDQSYLNEATHKSSQRVTLTDWDCVKIPKYTPCVTEQGKGWSQCHSWDPNNATHSGSNRLFYDVDAAWEREFVQQLVGEVRVQWLAQIPWQEGGEGDKGDAVG